MNTRQASLFQRVLAATGCPVAAAKAAGIPASSTLPVRRKVRSKGGNRARNNGVPKAPAPLSELEQAVSSLESEAVRRALSGVEIPVFHQGRECGSTVKHSDQLLMFLLKTLCPERYAGLKDPAPQPLHRPVILDIDLSAAEGGECEREEGESKEGENDEGAAHG